MRAVAGVFTTQSDAERVARKLHAMGMTEESVTLLLPGENVPEAVPVTTTEQSGMGKAIGGVIGAAAGAAGGLELGTAVSAVIPGVGPVVAIGLFGAALLGAAGAGVGAVIGEKAESATMEGLPEDEWFVYEDALRHGRSVVITVAEDESRAASVRNLLRQEGAESVDEAREKWWIGLRSAEEEHYSGLGGDFKQDEKFYRLGFQAAMHARTRGQEYDQVLMEMQEDVEKVKRQCPGVEAEEPFRRGYERGRTYFESLRNKAGK